MGLFFSSQQKKEKTIAIFDIGSGSIGGAIVSVPLNNKKFPTIIKSVRNEINFKENHDVNSFIKELTKNLELASESLFHKKGGSPEKIICVLTSPLYLSETRIIKMKINESFIFNKDLANKLIQKEISHFIESNKDKYNNIKSIPEIIEHHIVSVFLDGHIENNPLNKQCKSVEMSVIISLAPKLYLDKIKEVLSKTFYNSNITFSSFTFDSYLAVRDRYIKPNSYLLVDIGGEVTDIGVVIDGILKSTLSFPFGRKNFFKYISSELRIELRDAKELLKLYNDGNLSVSFNNKLVPILELINDSWGKAFDQCLGTLPNSFVVPNIIFLTIDDDIKDWFINMLNNKRYLQSLTSADKYIVASLEGSLFLDMCNINEGVCDHFLMIEAIAATRKINI